MTIYEKEDVVGGRNAAITTGRYTFDVGPTFFMMDFILREIFEECGRDLDDYVDLVPLDPYYEIIYSDGGELRLGPDRGKVKESIARFNPEDANGFEGFFEDNAEKLSRALPALQRGYSRNTDILSAEVLNMLPVLRPFTSLWDELGKHYSNDKVKIGFTFQSKYLGMSPYNCPSMFSIIPFIEHNWGIHHVTGGLNQLAEAMTTLFEELGGPPAKQPRYRGNTRGRGGEGPPPSRRDRGGIRRDSHGVRLRLFDKKSGPRGQKKEV
ncbi:MAG: phytoene desaturase family protein [Candidatus Acetothermia bacterium]